MREMEGTGRNKGQTRRREKKKRNKGCPQTPKRGRMSLADKKKTHKKKTRDGEAK